MHNPPARCGWTLACIAAGLLLSCAAHAQLSVSVSADSDYRFRGVSLSDSKPVVRLSANFDAASGWYAGASTTRAPSSSDERYAQLLGYAGYATPIADGRSLEVGFSYSHFIGNSRFDYAEPYVGVLSERWTLRLSYSPDYFGGHVQTAYVDASAHVQLSDKARLFGHVGLLAPLSGGPPRSPYSDANRTRADLRVGAGWALQDVDLQIAWAMASSGGPFPAVSGGRRGGWVFSASYSF